MNLKTNVKGITLIALVVTIIVLLILAGVAINLTIGDNGIFKRAQQATEEYSKSEAKEKIEMLLADFQIGKVNGEESDLKKYLIKNLQVGVAINEDGNYTFNLGEWAVTLNENQLISIEKFKINVDKTYPNVASMKADSALTNGNLVQTEGYWDKQYGGSAYYDIVSTTSLTVDDAKCIQLDNGLYAELHPINDTVTVNQFGAYGDGEHDDAEAINLSINSNYSNIFFESKKYKINRRIDIISSDKTIIGNDTTIFYNDEFVFVDDFIIGIFNNQGAITDNILIQNLSLINNNTTRTDEHLMLKVIRSGKYRSIQM